MTDINSVCFEKSNNSFSKEQKSNVFPMSIAYTQALQGLKNVGEKIMETGASKINSIIDAVLRRPDIILYHRPRCGYCMKVLNHLKEAGITVALKDTQDAAVKAELATIGGKSQVPCLVIDGRPLYESNDIISWFKENEDLFLKN